MSQDIDAELQEIQRDLQSVVDCMKAPDAPDAQRCAYIWILLDDFAFCFQLHVLFVSRYRKSPGCGSHVLHRSVKRSVSYAGGVTHLIIRGDVLHCTEVRASVCIPALTGAEVTS
ncbi:hypothetical protein ERJ75_000361700 [Trypanosoma vivax]|nr:hypothetical protein ERJ75_000361700 [Trypanosoma vivax]